VDDTPKTMQAFYFSCSFLFLGEVCNAFCALAFLYIFEVTFLLFVFERFFCLFCCLGSNILHSVHCATLSYLYLGLVGFTTWPAIIKVHCTSTLCKIPCRTMIYYIYSLTSPYCTEIGSARKYISIVILFLWAG